MQRVLEEKEKVMEAFLQNPDLRNYGFFAQGNINAYAQYPKPDSQSMSKEQGMKAYSQSDMKSSVPLGLLSQMSRPPEVSAPNLIQPNLNLMRPKPDEVVQQAQNLALFESALRMRLGEQAFVQQHQQQHFQQQEGKMKQPAQQQQSMTAAFRRNMTSPGVSEESHGRSNAQPQNLAAYQQSEAHSTVSSPTQSQRPDFACGQPARGGETSRNEVPRTSHATHIPSHTMPSHARSVHTPMSLEAQAKNIPPESVAAFMRAMQNLTSTEVGKAVIPPDTLADIMQAMHNKAEEIMIHSPEQVKIKSEFSSNDEQRGSRDNDLEQQYLSHADAKLKSDLTAQTLLAFNHDLRMKGMAGQQPMPLVVQPHGDPKGLKSSEAVFPGCSPLHAFPCDQGLFPTNMSTKPAKKPKERPHICLVCNMAFSQKNHLQVHERKHTGEKPYRCPMCDAAFARKDGLVIHQRKHTGERPYKCSFCDSAFTRKDKMVIHERTHTGEKPYQCNQCESKYTRKDKLTLHLKKHALAAQKQLEKVLQSTSAVVTSLALQGTAGSLGLPHTAANPQSLPTSSTAASSAAESTANTSLSLPSTASSSNMGLQNTIAANLSLPSAVASNVQNSLLGNLTLQNAVAANLNAVAANLSLQTAVIGNNGGMPEGSPANLSLQDSSVSNLSMHETGATNLSTTPLSSGS